MDAQEQRVEIEFARFGDDDLVVEHAARRRILFQWLDQVGEIAIERLGLARLEKNLVAVAEDQCAKSVPFRFVQPAVSLGEGGGQLGEHGPDRWRDHAAIIRHVPGWRPRRPRVRSASMQRFHRLRLVARALVYALLLGVAALGLVLAWLWPRCEGNDCPSVERLRDYRPP